MLSHSAETELAVKFSCSGQTCATAATCVAGACLPLLSAQLQTVAQSLQRNSRGYLYKPRKRVDIECLQY